MFRRVSFDGTVENVADLDGSVPTGAKQIQGRNADQRTHFMIDGGSAVKKEAFDGVEGGHSQFFEQAESKGLSCGRVDPIEDGVCACTLNPFRSAVEKYTAACVRELKAGVTFGTLQAARQ